MTISSKGKAHKTLLSRLKIWLADGKSKRKADTGNLYDEAAAKFLNLHGDSANLEDWQEFQIWMAKSDEHVRVIGTMDQLWHGMEQIDAIPWPDEEACRADKYDGRHPLPVMKAVSSKKITALRRIPTPAEGKKGWLAGLSLSAAAACLLTVFYLWPLLFSQQLYQTEIGEHQLVTLPDGSEMLLGGKTTATVYYSKDMRRVYLDNGEALFTVAKDRERPFVVFSGKANVVAVGTRFNVRRLGSDVLVSVVEGIVNVSSKPLQDYKARDLVQVVSDLSKSTPNNLLPEVTRLTIGQQIELSDRRIEGKVRNVNNEEVLSWRDGRLLYPGNPLRVVIADVSRYHNRSIRIFDEELGDLMFSGTVREDEIDDWLQGLQSVFEVEVITTENQVVIKKARNKESNNGL